MTLSNKKEGVVCGGKLRVGNKEGGDGKSIGVRGIR